MHLYRASLLFVLSLLIGIITVLVTAERVSAQQTQPQPQQIVESVEIIGNRRLRKDDILYYIQTRPGDPYNVEQVQRDLSNTSFTDFLRQNQDSRVNGNRTARRHE